MGAYDDAKQEWDRYTREDVVEELTAAAKRIKMPNAMLKRLLDEAEIVPAEVETCPYCDEAEDVCDCCPTCHHCPEDCAFTKCGTE